MLNETEYHMSCIYNGLFLSLLVAFNLCEPSGSLLAPVAGMLELICLM